jgi:hypothetical protein
VRREKMLPPERASREIGLGVTASVLPGVEFRASFVHRKSYPLAGSETEPSG